MAGHEVKKEDGSVLVLFAICFTVIIFFVGMVIDVGMIYMMRSEMMNLCQMIRDDRFTYQDTIRYSNNPGEESYKLAKRTMDENRFDGQLTVYFKEEPPELNVRKYQVRTQLSKEYSYKFLNVFGGTTVIITVTLDGNEVFGNEAEVVVWHPHRPIIEYNGSYSSENGDGIEFNSGLYPADW